jgi:hypothetical protein
MQACAAKIALAGLVGCVGLLGCASSPGSDGSSDDPGGKADSGEADKLYADQESVLEFSLDGPLTELFATGWDLYQRKHDNDPNNDQKLVVMGTLTWTDPTNNAMKIPVSLELHGNTALFDCDFRKLTVSFDKAHPELQKGTPFAGVKKFVLRTHCGDHPIDYRTPTYGRVSNEISVRREAFVYKTLEAMGVASHRTRLAKVHYTDGTNIDVTRQAFLLEDTKQMAARLGGTYVDPAVTLPWSDNPDMDIGVGAMARVALAENLVGNFDWQIDRTGRPGRWTPGSAGTSRSLRAARPISCSSLTTSISPRW